MCLTIALISTRCFVHVVVLWLNVYGWKVVRYQMASVRVCESVWMCACVDLCVLTYLLKCDDRTSLHASAFFYLFIQQKIWFFYRHICDEFELFWKRKNLIKYMIKFHCVYVVTSVLLFLRKLQPILSFYHRTVVLWLKFAAQILKTNLLQAFALIFIDKHGLFVVKSN